MRDFLARLALRDESVAAALRVLDYFDALDARGVGPEAYVRGAAALTSRVVGVALAGRRLSLRVGPGGDRLRGEAVADKGEEWPSRAIGPGDTDRVWIESTDVDTSYDLVLERIAQGIQRWADRLDALAPEPEQAWATLLNDPIPEERSRQLFAALRLDSARRYHVVAHLPVDWGDGLRASAVVRGTAVGATIQPAPFAMGPQVGGKGRFGIGPAVPVEELRSSWKRAVIVLRMARPGEALTWDRLGVLAPLFLHAQTSDLLASPIISAIEAGNLPWLDETVTAVTQTGSIRGAADLLGLHHSTVQKRIDKLQQQFDLNLGNARHAYHLWLACAAHRYASFGTPENMELDVRLTPRPFDDPSS
ncbi:helix-turn-helix domain-containing protein [Microbacterium sp. BG28]|uniref:helix-turn-helix domain-containing protein n=1 Tax=Microbacterium sp. BG28 TaxID=3097356 RepID=UPI002A5AB537|nr:helix-turn-helix domain-containing protein [Microbacterium sp. BG28]MDY0828505.1 helix-turn-helix domain-containing protein [Microbacterium sp. BG28]